MTQETAGGAEGGPGPEEAALMDLVRDATVRIHRRGDGYATDGPGPGFLGSGFFIAPSWVLTCAHVAMQGAKREVNVLFRTDPYDAELTEVPGVVVAALPETRPAGAQGWPAPDLALIQLRRPVEHPCVYVTERSEAMLRGRRVRVVGWAPAPGGGLTTLSGDCEVKGTFGGWADADQQIRLAEAEAFRRCDEPDSPAMLQVAIPPALLGLDVDNWKVTPDGLPLGAVRPVVVRRSAREQPPDDDVERLRRARWNGTRNSSAQAEVIDCEDGMGVRVPEVARLHTLAYETVPVLCRYGGRPDPETTAGLVRILDGGFGVALWRRTGEPDEVCTEFHRRALNTVAETAAMEQAAVEHLRRERGEKDLEFLRASNGLAADLRGLGRYEDALEMSQRLLNSYREILGEDSRTMAAQNNLAISLRLLGRYEESRELNRRTLDKHRDRLGHRHAFTLSSEINYSTDLQLLGRYAEAESLQSQSTRRHRTVLGEDNPKTLLSEHNLALCRYRGGDRTAAASLFTRVLERSERVLGEDDPLTMMFAAGQSCFAREHADIDQARAISERVVDGYVRMLGETRPYVAGVRSNHALILRNVGEREQAHVLGENALLDTTRAVGENHPWTLGVAINASALRNLVGDPESAAALTESVVARAAEALGRTHPLSLSARIAYAADLRGTRDRQRADKVESEALGDLVSTLGAQHVHTVSARSRNRPFWDFEPQLI